MWGRHTHTHTRSRRPETETPKTGPEPRIRAPRARAGGRGARRRRRPPRAQSGRGGSCVASGSADGRAARRSLLLENTPTYAWRRALETSVGVMRVSLWTVAVLAVCSSVISDFPLRPLGLCHCLKGFKNAHRRRHRPGTGTISSRRPARLPSPAEPARQGRERRAGNELIGPVALLRVSAHGRPFPPAAAMCGGGGGPPGSGVALAHSGSPGSRAEGAVAVRPGQANLCSNRGRRAAPFWTQRV